MATRPGCKIDEKIMIQALGEGKTKKEAGILAGSTNKNPSQAVGVKLASKPELVEIVKEKLNMTLKSMTEVDVSKIDAYKKSGIVKNLHSIVLLEEGRPTEIKTNLNVFTTHELLLRAQEILDEQGVNKTRVIDSETLEEVE